MRAMAYLRLTLLALAALTQTIATAEGYNFLVLTPFGSRSVRASFHILCEGLLANGHNVTLVSSGEPIPDHENLVHVTSPHTALDQLDLFKVRMGLSVFQIWKKAFPEAARQMYQSKEILDVWKRRQDYDGIIINSAANEMAFPFLINTTAPFITLQPAGIDPLQLAYLGNIISPAAIPSIILPYDDHMTLWERLVNTATLIILKYSFQKSVGKPLADVLKPMFPDLPEPRAMYPRQSLALFNSHPLIDGPVPLLPTQVEVGCLSCRPAKPLHDQKLIHFLDGAGEGGALFFTLGSFQRPERIPAEYISLILEAFSLLPQYRIVALLDVEPSRVPANVFTKTWFPQQDVLGHPSMCLFLSHCGRQSVNQALYHGVPVLGLPIAFDQPRHCRRLQRRGEATVLQWETLTVLQLTDTVLHMMQNTSYAVRAKRVSSRLKAQKETGLERAVWHIEDVVSSTQGHEVLMQYSGSRLSLAEYMLLDVMAILATLALLLALVAAWTVRALYRCLKKKKPKQNFDDDKTKVD